MYLRSNWSKFELFRHFVLCLFLKIRELTDMEVEYRELPWEAKLLILFLLENIINFGYTINLTNKHVRIRSRRICTVLFRIITITIEINYQ